MAPASAVSVVTRKSASLVHAVAGMAAIATILAFQAATIGVELFGTVEAVATAKRSIWLGIPLLVAALMAAGGSGNWLAQGNGSTVVRRKRRRMAITAANGVLVLIPSAYLLQRWAAVGSLDAAFYTVQALELAAGGVNLVLLVRNAWDGRRLAGRNPQATSRRA